MSKQPHVWVVEIRTGIEWTPISKCIEKEPKARELMVVWKKQWPTATLRVAKYVRVEPKKGRKT